MFVALLIMILISAYADDLNIVVDLKWKNAFQFAGFYIAKEKGYYKKYGINVILKELNKNDPVKDVLNNKAQFGIANSSLIYYKLKGKPVVALMPIFENSPVAIISTDPSVKSLKDLKNKIIHTPKVAFYNIAIIGMLKKAGLNINNLKITNKPFSIKDLITTKGVYVIYTTDQIYYLEKNHINFKLFSPLNENINAYGDILFTSEDFLKHHPKTVKNFIKATQKGWNYAKTHVNEAIKIILKKYNTQHFSYSKLKNEAYKTLPLLSENYLFKREKIEQLILLYQLIFNINSNFNFLNFVYSPYITNKKEKNFIENHLIHCIITSTWPPFNFMKDNELTGISIDFWNLIKNKLYLKTFCEIAPNFTFALNKIKNKKADVIPNTTNTPKREKYSIFTKAYVKYPIVIATKNNINFIPDIKSLKNKKIAIGKNYSAYEIIKLHYPNLNIIPVSTTQEGLKLLEKDKVFAVIDIFPVLAYYIAKNRYLDIAITGTTPFSFPLKIMIRNDYKILQELINNVISDLSDKSKINILNKYVSVNIYKVYKGIAPEKVKQKFLIGMIIIFGLILILTLLIYFYFKMNQIKRKLEIIATHDKLLTDIFNRLEINKRLKNEIETAKRYNIPLSVIYFDIDHFKKINDTYGHEKGDFVLKEIARLITLNLRKTDIFGRWGGEEFLIVLPFTDLKNAFKLAEKLRKIIENYNFNGIKVTISFGVAEFNKNDNTDTLINRADKALYQAKESGRNRVVYIK